MKRQEIIKSILKNLKGKGAIISSTGLISREIFNIKDTPQNFYMTGSLGLASSIGLGVAINKPRRKIIVIEGDASLLMNLGSLATIGHFRPKNLIHIVLDNRAYDSCSGEVSISNTAKFNKIAKIVGYKIVKKVTNQKDLQKVLKKSLDQYGPIFILVKVEKGGRRDLPRPLELDKIAERFKKFISKKD